MDDEFLRDLSSVLNKHNMDGRANTPDFLLADYLYGSLLNYIRVKEENEEWHGGAAPRIRIGSESGVHLDD